MEADNIRHSCYTPRVCAANYPQPNLLILGGGSSLASHLIQEALEDNYHVTATVRELPKPPQVGDTRWVQLDLETDESISSFFSAIENTKFQRIIYCIGKTSAPISSKKSVGEVDDYFRIQLSHGAWVIENLIQHLETEGASQLIFVSSRASTFPSYDAHYAACKAGLQALVSSLSLRVASNQSLVSVTSGLLLNSTMYLDMPVDVRVGHETRSGNKLLTVEQAATQIWKVEMSAAVGINGQVIEIGPTYK